MGKNTWIYEQKEMWAGMYSTGVSTGDPTLQRAQEVPGHKKCHKGMLPIVEKISRWKQWVYIYNRSIQNTK